MFIIINRRLIIFKKVLVWMKIFLLALILGLAGYMLIKYIDSTESYVPRGIKIDGIPFEASSQEEARTKLIEISKLKSRWPKEPKFERGYLDEGEAGKFIAINQTLDKIHKASVNSNITPIYYNILPMSNINQFEKIKFGKGTDKEAHYLTGEEIKELKTIANELFDTVIYPGETFSLADFWQANNLNDDFSSQISQLVARTLYNSVKKAKLEVKESYVINQPKLGSLYDDNLEFQPGKDFKFSNNSSSPILIKGEVDKKSFKLWVLGS